MPREARRPDLFLVGAPKCGTTALYSYLRRHPDVFMCEPKEPQFFAADVCGHQRNITGLPEYLNCFAGANGQKRAGEASTCYLGSPQAARDIGAFSPTARVIIMLRNPVDVMYAQHSERRFAGTEPIRDFQIAIDSDEERKWRAGRFKGEPIIRPRYRELARYADAVKRYLDLFGRENVRVIVYDDFCSNPSQVFAETLRFLDVRPPGEMRYEVRNENRRARSDAVQRFINHPPKSVRGLVRSAFARSWRSAIGKTMERWNAVYGPRPPMNPQLRARLQTECKPDIEALSRLLNRDLSHWCEHHA